VAYRHVYHLLPLRFGSWRVIRRSGNSKEIDIYYLDYSHQDNKII
jgi:hypothetical protein